MKTKLNRKDNEKLNNSLSNAISITWERCHKIYICTSESAHRQLGEWGYDLELIDAKGNVQNGVPAKERLLEWFDDSCSLRFIQKVSGDERDGIKFDNIVGQSDY